MNDQEFKLILRRGQIIPSSYTYLMCWPLKSRKNIGIAKDMANSGRILFCS